MLDKEAVEMIKRWIKLGPTRSHRCPFRDTPGYGKVCEALFPKIVKESYCTPRPCHATSLCPCDIYSPKYVYAKAKKIVKENS